MANIRALEVVLKQLVRSGYSNDDILAEVKEILERKVSKKSTREQLRKSAPTLPDSELELRRAIKMAHPDTGDTPDVDRYMAALMKLRRLKEKK